MPTQPEPPIGERIREERLRRGCNLRTLARAVNVSASHISQIENGKCQPSVSTLYAITSVLGVSIDNLFSRPEAEPVKAAAGLSAAPAGLVALAADHARRMGPIVGPSDRETLELDSGVTWDRLGHVPGLA